jgi:hypothetical protein
VKAEHYQEGLMEVKGKVVAAIASALGHYLQAEEEAAALAMQQKRLAERPRLQYLPFAMAGRQASMEARWMWQMRLAR